MPDDPEMLPISYRKRTEIGHQLRDRRPALAGRAGAEQGLSDPRVALADADFRTRAFVAELSRYRYESHLAIGR